MKNDISDKSMITDDSVFCPNNKEKKEAQRKNNVAALGFMLFFIDLIVVDTFLMKIFQDSHFLFVLSCVLYILAICFGCLSLGIDYQDKKKGYQPTGNLGYAIISIVSSLFVFLTNMNGLVL